MWNAIDNVTTDTKRAEREDFSKRCSRRNKLCMVKEINSASSSCRMTTTADYAPVDVEVLIDIATPYVSYNWSSAAIGGKDPAEYGRPVLKALFSEYDLATKLMPSPMDVKDPIMNY
ncbi:unnamed protein product [Didymodactylos carnosus]|uniref:Uncharacterized protein n=1 Tax=Didymodactylos carnosus TaxID=1234261 RepID=A0A815A1J7_9BILA|nr:unnamed protein product [Didymodactylos carnosus]CAF4017479.1 unnamed protein product [Didymodactylos carnosus]